MRYLVTGIIAIILATMLHGLGFSTQTYPKMIRPFNEYEFQGWYVSGKYGSQREHRKHWAVDYALPIGTSILAPADGVITLSKYSGSYGNLIIIDHGDGVVSKLAHLSEFIKLRGQSVSKGEVIGYSGDTGNAQGRPHVHFEVELHGQHVSPARFIF